MKTASTLLIVLSLLGSGGSQEPAGKASQAVPVTLLCGTVIQPANGQVQHDVLITVEGDSHQGVARKKRDAGRSECD